MTVTTATPEHERGTQGTAGALRRLLRMRETGLVLIILTLFVVMSFASEYFLTWANMRAMAMALLARDSRIPHPSSTTSASGRGAISEAA